MLGAIIHNELKVEPHIRNMCKKATQKLGLLNKLTSFLNLEKKNHVFDVH